MDISLLDMGKTKKRNVREGVISILSKEYPLSIKKMFNAIKKEYKLDVTYQAVFKLVKEMVDDSILIADGMEYKLNIGWIKQLEQEIGVLKKNYESDEEEHKKNSVHEEINEFISKLGPRLKAYLAKDKCCVIGASGGGKLYGMALWKYFLREGIDSKYQDYNPLLDVNTNKISIVKADIIDRKLFVVDSSVHSGRTYNLVMNSLNKHKKSLKFIDLKYVTDRDLTGLADFSLRRS